MPKTTTGNSIPVSTAPIQASSGDDSDFKPGPYLYDRNEQSKRGHDSTRRRGRVRRSEILGLRNAQGKRNRPLRQKHLHGPNPLLEYFEDGLDLHSASEEELDRADQSDDYNIDDEERESSDQDDENSVRPVISNTLAEVNQQHAKPVSNLCVSNIQEDDSTTDSDSDLESQLKRKIARHKDKNPAEAYGQLLQGGESMTESDISEMHIPLKTVQSSREDSETESESETELPANPRLKPRPGFPLAPGQRYLGPLILDRDEKYMVPAAINTYLRDYQRDGIRFFWKLYKEGRGGLLGDDMGLVSKTIQIISFLSAVMRKDGVLTDKNRRRQHVFKLQDAETWKQHRELPPADAVWPTCLIIAPSTVAHNWEREFETWGYFEVGMYVGSPGERGPVLNDFKMGRLDVVLTTFDIARKDIDVLDSLPWSCIIVDEVHRVKNETAKITKAYHQFRCLRRFGLTGTTIQNSYGEMWTILDWTNPGRLGTSRQWKGFIVKPLTTGQSASSTEEERAKAVAVALVLREKLLPKFFLRRTKDIIRNQLPRKIDHVVFCPLTQKQITAYKNLLKMEQVQNLIHRTTPCPCGSGKSRQTCCHPFVPGDVFKFMSILIKLSNHLGLILPAPVDSPEQTLRHRALSEIAFPDGNIPKYGTAMMQPQYCGKWAVLGHLLKEWRKDSTNKVLIFTKSVKLLEMLEFHLHTEGYGFLKLDGNTKQSERMPMIDQFHTDPDIFIFLISTLAGGTGLNLTGANRVVIFGT
ncbi:hypothetical protein AX17_003023 [Amanita inopinata Kibby_2008]|nr:hypothetical protein AX17_003023 [Amanita inopinata Kibby_2008]